MWSLRSKPSTIHGASHLSTLQSLIHLRHSSQSIQTDPHFMVDYLVNSIGFSKPQASSTSAKLTHLKSTQNPNSVLDFLKQCGLDNTQVRSVVSHCPKILTTSVHKTLGPKFRVLQALDLPGTELEKLLKQSSYFSSNRLVDNVNYLRKLLCNDDKVSKVIRRSWWMLSSNYEHKLSISLGLLKKYGLSYDKFETILLRNPACLLQSPEWLEAVINKVEPVLGISPKSPRFVDGFEIVASLSKSTLDKKLGVFRRFGWSDSEILTMTSSLPVCLRYSEAKLEAILEFFMKELGYTAVYLASHPKLLVYSLEKRVMPRNKVLRVLKEKNVLKNNFSLCSIVALAEEKFVKDFVLPYLEVVPNLYEGYTNVANRLQTIK